MVVLSHGEEKKCACFLGPGKLEHLQNWRIKKLAQKLGRIGKKERQHQEWNARAREISTLETSGRQPKDNFYRKRKHGKNRINQAILLRAVLAFCKRKINFLLELVKTIVLYVLPIKIAHWKFSKIFKKDRLFRRGGGDLKEWGAGKKGKKTEKREIHYFPNLARVLSRFKML